MPRRAPVILTRSVGLRAACKDPALIPLQPHDGQDEFLGLIEENRMTFGACGRRWGKSRMVAAAGLHNLLLCPEADALVSPGETRFALIVSNSREQSLILLEHGRTLVKASPSLSHELVEDSEYALRFRGDRAFLAVPCNSRSIRGYAASFVAFDEMSHYIDEEQGGPRVAQRLWSSLTPSIAQFREFGKVVGISTPAGTANLFAELWHKAHAGELPQAAAFYAPTSANPMIDPAYLEAQRAALGLDEFDREFNASFASGTGTYMSAESIRDCVQDWKEVLPSDGRDWVVSFDPSFSRDASALAVVGRRHDDRRRLLVGYTQRWLPSHKKRRVRRSRDEETAFIEQVVRDVAAVCVRYRVHRLIVDQHMSGTMESEFQKHGLRTVVRSWSRESKTDAFRSLRALVDSDRIELPDDPVLIAEAGRLRERQRGGSPTIETPRSGDSHCDLVIAVAGGVLELERHPHMKARTYSAVKGLVPPSDHSILPPGYGQGWGDY